MSDQPQKEPPVSAWQPIDSAPKDGTVVRLRRVYEGHVIAEGFGYFSDVTIHYAGGPYVSVNGLEYAEPSSEDYEDVWIRADGTYLFPAPTHWCVGRPTRGRRTAVSEQKRPQNCERLGHLFGADARCMFCGHAYGAQPVPAPAARPQEPRERVAKLAESFAMEFLTGHHRPLREDEHRQFDQLRVVMLAFAATIRPAADLQSRLDAIQPQIEAVRQEMQQERFRGGDHPAFTVSAELLDRWIALLGAPITEKSALDPK